MPYGPANFYLTVVKPYYIEEVPENEQHHDDQLEENNELTTEIAELTARNEQVQYYGQG
jgi:hypothetical protein